MPSSGLSRGARLGDQRGELGPGDGGQRAASVAGGVDGVDQLVGQRRLGDDGVGAGDHRPGDERDSGEGGVDNDARGEGEGAESAGQLEAALAVHVKVDNGDLGVQPPRGSECLGVVVNTGKHLDSALVAQQVGEPAQHHRVIVDDEHSERSERDDRRGWVSWHAPPGGGVVC